MSKALAIVTLFFASVLFVSAPHASAAQAAAPALEGTWTVEVSVDPSLPVGDFVALETYGRDGGLVTSNNVNRAAGLDVGQGAWIKVGPRQYRTAIVFFVFNPDGSRAGSLEVSHIVTLLAADAYSGEGQATRRDTHGAVLATAAFRTSGRRWVGMPF